MLAVHAGAHGCTSQFLQLPCPIPQMNMLVESAQTWQPAEAAAAAAEAGATGQPGGAQHLPRGAIVRIVGNNRTKRELCGQRAVVQRAVGLGGWHHCVLDDGTEVKLQRNALAVLELPEEGEEDQGLSGESSDTEAREPHLHGLHPCFPYSPPAAAYAVPEVPLLYKKASGTSTSSGYRSSSHTLVNLHKLEAVSLKRYRRVFQLGGAEESPHKEALLPAVLRHFTSQDVHEASVLSEFVGTLRRRYRRQQLMLQQCGEQGEGGSCQPYLLQQQPRVLLFK